MSFDRVSFLFGLVTCGAGITGILLGSGSAYFVKKREPGGDAIVCAVGLILSSILLYLAIFIIEFNIYVCWVRFLSYTCSYFIKVVLRVMIMK